MSKVPCGGFNLDENFLGMNENGELSLVASDDNKVYQYLVTDGSGNVKWEDRLAYDDSKVVVDIGYGAQLVKVADEIPSWASVDVPIKVWVSNGESDTITPERYRDFGNGSFRILDNVYFITTDNFEVQFDTNSLVFPEKGVYFLFMPSYISATGIASAESDMPEITWDGNIETIKTIDPKYIPSELNEIVLPSSTSGSSKKFKITVDDSGTISATEVTT